MTNTTKYQKMEKDLAVFVCVCAFSFREVGGGVGLPKSYFNFSNLVILSLYQQYTFRFSLFYDRYSFHPVRIILPSVMKGTLIT